MERGFEITANRVDLLSGRIAPQTVVVRDGQIQTIVPAASAEGFLIPGFVDAHVHIESSMLLPAEFARAASIHGTVATVSDPHEIANVCGVEGIELMLRNAAATPFKFFFGAPSCVPATRFETAGAELDAATVARLLDDPRIGYLSEVMDYPGVIAGQPEVLGKIAAAAQRGMPVDGHAPGLRGDELARYLRAGISTDHETMSLEEAWEKIELGCSIAIREGSAAKNFAALWPLLDQHPAACMFCSDDKHPDALVAGHINQLVARAVERGCDLMNTLRAACLNPVRHYGLDVGLIQLGDPADFVVLDDLRSFQPRQTFIRGIRVAADGCSELPATPPDRINRFEANQISAAALRVPAETRHVRVIEAVDGQLYTHAGVEEAVIGDGVALVCPDRDLLKLVVVNRYRDAIPRVAFVRGFGLRQGALASSVAHDSHNVVAVGVEDESIAAAVNQVIEQRGGLAVASIGSTDVLPLPVAGLMATGTCQQVAGHYARLDAHAKSMGCQLSTPFMTLSFLALPVIPALKLTDLGLFDVEQFRFTPLFA